ncbi:putative type II secretion system protein [Candidatus Campylobacter infans]|uniref:Putative type II secretion system protein n=1 Tax=Candidatus Campylobacter infans TaxID=2561898 RepID=A0A7H9CMR3_9BACT|nr:type II secretion system protein [Candidatus Campylobacter infans]QLI06099.1 putative type II secretion system protein [Candidatus Campylobacter infans]
MKKGFTMIELIFVIVILGVLASVAIPRLAATRDDAEVAKAATNLTTAVSDITAYYTAKGNFNGVTSDFTKITNALTKDGKLNVKGKTECVSVALPTTNAGQHNTSSKVEITLTFKDDDAVCKTLKTLPGIKAMCGKSGDQESISNTCTIQVGGSGGIQF